MSASMPAWLVMCRDIPSRKRWIRPDALSRIASAAVQMHSTCFLLFQDGTLVRLDPGHEPWQSQDELINRIEALLEGRPLAFAWCKHFASLEQCMHTVLRDGQLFQRIMHFREDGDFLLANVRQMQIGTKAVASDTSRILCVLGGVRDASDEELKALRKVSEELEIQISAVSLGGTPELTSKCMEAVGIISACRPLAAVVDDCKGRPCPRLQARAPLHIIYKLGLSFQEFMSERAAVNKLLIYTFMASHSKVGGIMKNTVLTIINGEGEGLTIEMPSGNFLDEEASLKRMQSALEVWLADPDKPDLVRILKRWALRLRNHCDFRVLHADESAKPFLDLQSRTVMSNSRAVAVVIGYTDASLVKRAAVLASACAFEHASIGSGLAAVAFASIAHHEGRLAAAICKPLNDAESPSCPTKRISQAKKAIFPAPTRRTAWAPQSSQSSQSSPSSTSQSSPSKTASPASTRAPSRCESECAEQPELVDVGVQAVPQIVGLDDFLSKCGRHVANEYTADDFNNALGGFDEINELFELITSKEQCTHYLGKILKPIHLKKVWEQIEIERSRLGLALRCSSLTAGIATTVGESAQRAEPSDAGHALDIASSRVVDTDKVVDEEALEKVECVGPKAVPQANRPPDKKAWADLFRK